MTMMSYQLTTQAMFRQAIELFAKKEIVSRTASGSTVRQTYRQLGERTAQLAHALQRLGVQRGERIGTFGWNHHRHLEAYWAVPNMGAVLHTINIRLFQDQLVYIINHAEDSVLLIDSDVLPLIEQLGGQLKSVRHYVVWCDGPLPQTSLSPVHSYEDLLASEDTSIDWPEIDENTPAAMCYTSATTGNPRGVTYTHRSQYLHTLAGGFANSLGLSERDVTLPFVPMFHANGWGLPYSTVLFGTTVVLPGPRPDAKAVLDLMQEERVTVAAGVPTIWIACVPLLEQRTYELSSVRAIVCGGSAIPPALLQKYDSFGLPFLHAYGMTETSPLATVSHLRSYMDEWPEDRKLATRAKQGTPVPGLLTRVVDEQGKNVPRDGTTYGELLMRGPWVADEYYKQPEAAAQFRDGWLHSGDIVTWDEDGYVSIVDRVKDLVKSGGEWISSVDLENAIMAIPGVAEAAVVGIPHPKWQERPLACVVARPEFKERLTKEAILEPLRTQFASWWIPDDVVFLDEIPKTSVGKFQKRVLRERFANHQLPG